MSTIQKLAACWLCLLLIPGISLCAEAAKEPELRPIHITVTDAEKNPVSGLQIDIISQDGEAYATEQDSLWLPFTTGTDGRCSIPGHETGRAYRLTLSNPYARPEQKQNTDFRLNEDGQPYSLQLCWEGEAPGESLRRIPDKLVLHFVDEKGAPAENLLVRYERDTFFSAFPDKFFTGTDGQFSPLDPNGRLILLSPPTGSYTLTASRMDDGTACSFLLPYAGGSKEYTLPLPSPADKKGQPSSQKQPEQEIAIRVIDAAGKAVPDVVVSAEPLRMPETGTPLPLRARKAGRDGVYRNQAILYTTYTLYAQNNLLSSAYLQKHELSVTPETAGQLYTVVFEGEPPLTTLEKIEEKTVLYFYRPSGQPAAGLQVTVKRADTGKTVSDGWTDYEGKYLLLQLKPASYILTATDEATGESARYTVDTTPGASLRFELSFPESSK
ncbi:MAG: carboxypeptidase regulatory-like domain-containing protein [Provencibacterium sp.]|nr:carboxypeptidase regulatory-like domain-containing protein [Provencibacterium sp.]